MYPHCIEVYLEICVRVCFWKSLIKTQPSLIAVVRSGCWQRMRTYPDNVTRDFSASLPVYTKLGCAHHPAGILSFVYQPSMRRSANSRQVYICVLSDSKCWLSYNKRGREKKTTEPTDSRQAHIICDVNQQTGDSFVTRRANEEGWNSTKQSGSY